MIQNNTLNFLAVRLKILRVNVSILENCVKYKIFNDSLKDYKILNPVPDRIISKDLFDC